ncbi:MAG TPA: hypothetical protein VKQ52_00955 [Puia sp.]|nr:hypothetical protein [Puia sp.]
MRIDEFDRIYRAGFLNLANVYLADYENGVFKLEMLNTLPVPRKVVLTVYFHLVSSKELIPIEQLEKGVKAKLWKLCKPFTLGLNADGCRDIARCYLTLDHLLAKKEAGE